MNNVHLPVISLLILLATAALIPVIRKSFDSVLKVFVLSALGISWLLSLLTLLNVLRYGSFVYNFGNWNQKIGIQFKVDEFSAIMTLMIFTISALIIVYALKDMEHEINPKQFSGYYTLVFLLMFSMVGMTFTNDLFNMYVFMEILSLTSCSIISVKKKKENYLASFRYLMLNTIGSLSVLMGIALIYMVTGHLNMTEINYTVLQVWQEYPRNIMLSLGFIMTGICIKAALFPLHIWLPDAHSNAPTPSSALLSGLVVKVYIFCAAKILFRVIGQSTIVELGIPTFLTYFAALSMIMGSVFAIGQKDIKRMLAYSSVAQLGYIFLGLGLATTQGLEAGFFHIMSHAMMKVALFLSAGAIIYYNGKRDVRELEGIGYKMPITMGVFSIAAISMVGIPGLSGFMSKIYLSFAVLDAQKPFYIIIILISSFLNAVYYLPIIIAAFLKGHKEKEVAMELDKLPKSMLVPMVIVASGLIIVGVFPRLIMDIIQVAVPTFLP